ncbi:MAG TPA: hypothetical protein PKD85_21580, partial [Saprospiraceae bacterium]|nr:hypothetical protein [Saprospiraceae bacterium]
MIKQILILISFAIFHTTVVSQSFDLNLKDKGLNYPMVLVPKGDLMIGKEPVKVHLDAYYIGIYEVDYPFYNAFFQDTEISQNDDYDAVTRPSPPYLDFTLGMGKDKG